MSSIARLENENELLEAFKQEDLKGARIRQIVLEREPLVYLGSVVLPQLDSSVHSVELEARVERLVVATREATALSEWVGPYPAVSWLTFTVEESDASLGWRRLMKLLRPNG